MLGEGERAFELPHQQFETKKIIIIRELENLSLHTHNTAKYLPLVQIRDLQMASRDPNPQGGSITDMAVEGTKIPNDAGTQNTIPSVPRPDQVTDPSNDPNNLGATDLAGAADNAQDISRVCDKPFPAFQMPSYTRPLDHNHPDIFINISLCHCRPHAIPPLAPKSSQAQAMPCLQRLALSDFTMM